MQHQDQHPSEPAGQIDEETWLLGQPRLSEYLSFVKRSVVGGREANPAHLVDEWRRANDHYHELESTEHGIADRIECNDVHPSLAPLVEEVTAAPSFRSTFDALPTSFAMVELDKLVVFQTSVTQTFVETLQAEVPKAPSLTDLFRFTMPLGQPTAEVKIQRLGSRRYAFRCDSTDFRFNEPVLLTSDQLPSSLGKSAAAVALVVGFGANLLNAVRVGKRIVLHNGYHRACALRGLGITHVPCIIQTVTRSDELELVAKDVVVEDPDFYFKTARPPLLKDFFDPKIRKVLRVHKQTRLIEVSFETSDVLVPA